MGLFSCDKCGKTLWLEYKTFPDGTHYCQDCYDKYRMDLKIEEEKKLQKIEAEKKYINDHTKLLKDKGLGELIYNFYKKYDGKPSQEDFIKLEKLLRIKHKINIDSKLFNKIIEKVYFFDKEEKDLENFEKELMGEKPKKPDKNYYCIICKKDIDKETYDYSYHYFNKPLCKEHQGTKQHRNLFFELLKRGINCDFEAWDGHKHVDLAIHEAKLYIEIDGSHHSTKPDQLFSDIMRDKYSSKQGYITKRFSNKMINDNLEKIADAICEVIKKIKKKT